MQKVTVFLQILGLVGLLAGGLLFDGIGFGLPQHPVQVSITGSLG